MIKHLLTTLCLLCTCALALPFAAASECADTLRAINWVENPTNHSRPGSRGELGPYQFLARTWRMHSRAPFLQAVQREHSDAVAVKHYEWIRRGLLAAGIDPNPYNIALAWNSGLGAVTSGRVPTVSYKYAERVSNLVERQRERRTSATSAPGSRGTFTGHTASATANPMFVFDPTGAPRFTIATTEPLFEPVVRTGKSGPAPAPDAPLPVVKIRDQEPAPPKFALNGAAAPRFALIR